MRARPPPPDDTLRTVRVKRGAGIQWPDCAARCQRTYAAALSEADEARVDALLAARGGSDGSASPAPGEGFALCAQDAARAAEVNARLRALVPEHVWSEFLAPEQPPAPAAPRAGWAAAAGAAAPDYLTAMRVRAPPRLSCGAPSLPTGPASPRRLRHVAFAQPLYKHAITWPSRSRFTSTRCRAAPPRAD
jgi:hypothetical protein